MWIFFITAWAGSMLELSEFVPNPAGADEGQEWVEVHARGDVDLSGARIEVALHPRDWVVAWTFPQGTLAHRDDFLVITSPSSPLASKPSLLRVEQSQSLGNAGANMDAIRLVMADGSVVDTVIYGDVDEGFEAFLPRLDAPMSGESLERFDGVWRVQASTTPGDPPQMPSTSSPEDTGIMQSCTPSSHVVLNEVLVDPEGTDADAEWVELTAAGQVDLEGWRIEAALHPGAWSLVWLLPSDAFITAGDHMVVYGAQASLSAVSGLHLGQMASMGNASQDADAVRLVDPAGCVVDQLSYGAKLDASGAFTDEQGVLIEASQLARVGMSGESMARAMDGVDHNNPVQDWIVSSTPTPGEVNGKTGCMPAGAVYLSEALIDPAGADARSSEAFVELYAAQAVSLAGWQLVSWTQPQSKQVWLAFGEDVRIEAGQRLTVGGADVPLVDIVIEDFDLPNGSGGDRLAVVDCEGHVVDAWIYGGEDVDNLAALDTAAQTILAPSVSESVCVGRVDFDGGLEVVSRLGSCSPGHENVAWQVSETSWSTGCSAPPPSAPETPDAPRLWAVSMLGLFWGGRRLRATGPVG